VVVRIRVVLEEDLAQPLGLAGEAARLVLDQPRVAVPVGVIDVEVPVLRVVRAEREPEHALLAVVEDERPDVEERTRAQMPPDDDADATHLLDDVEVVRLVRRRSHHHGLGQAARNPDDAQLAPLGAVARTEREPDGKHERGKRNGGEDDASHWGYLFSRTRRSSSSLPGSRIASTWSPG